MMSAGDVLTFRCKCGSVKASLQGPPVQNANCHCHSCVASAKFIESKPNFDGIPVLDVGGVAYADFRWENIKFSAPTPGMSSDEAQIGFVKVGEKGKLARSYCEKCGTMIGAFSSNNAFLNRNAIFYQNGSPYKSPNPVDNIMARFAFDPAKVPQPRYSIVPFGMIFSFIPSVLGFGEKKDTKTSPFFPADLSTVEAVPITWE